MRRSALETVAKMHRKSSLLAVDEAIAAVSGFFKEELRLSSESPSNETRERLVPAFSVLLQIGGFHSVSAVLEGMEGMGVQHRMEFQALLRSDAWLWNFNGCCEIQNEKRSPILMHYPHSDLSEMYGRWQHLLRTSSHSEAEKREREKRKQEALEFLGHSDPDVRSCAVYFLMRTSTVGSADILRNLAARSSDSSNVVKSALLLTFWKLAKRGDKLTADAVAKCIGTNVSLEQSSSSWNALRARPQKCTVQN